MKILLIASSAREHAIAEAIKRSRYAPALISISPGMNPGLIACSDHHRVGDIMNFDFVLQEAKKHAVDFAVVGPDDPIGAGLPDVLHAAGIPTVAPRKSVARIESSKGFARSLMARHGIHSYPKFYSLERAERKFLINILDQELQGEYVVKYDALKGGKGVKISGEHLPTIEDGVRYALACIEECGRVVIEEKLKGVEFSLLSFVSGTRVVDMPVVQDHKRAFDGDTGPNTGGMGSITDANHSLPFLAEADVHAASAINRSIAEALQRECGVPYTGILYGGFMAVRDGVRVIEYNARFGDPEALNLLPLLETDFVDLCLAIMDGSLSEEHVQFAKKATTCLYITPASYPDAKAEKGTPVTFPAMPENARLFFGDITRDPDGTLRLGGSRAAGIVGIGDSIPQAQAIALRLCQSVEGPVRFRTDIGTPQLLESRRAALQSIRS